MFRGKFSLAAAFLGAATSAASAASEWKIERDGGGVWVQSRISRLEESGKSRQRVEFVAVDTANASWDRYIGVLKDVSHHREILGPSVSRTLETLSDTSWLIYYFFDAPWPLRDSDCVAVMSLTRDAAGGMARFSIVSAPDRRPRQGVARLERYLTSFRFRDVGKGQVEIQVMADVVPAVQAPGFLLRAAFPGTAARMVEAVERLAGESSGEREASP